jgi:hypothetical protein
VPRPTVLYTVRPCHSPVASEEGQLEAFEDAENDVGVRGRQVGLGREGEWLTPIVLEIGLSRYAGGRNRRNHVR